MSSFEANTYTVKPAAVQVGNSITVTKPIIASNLLIKPQPEQRNQVAQQPKKIQPLPKAGRDHIGKPKSKAGGTSAVFQLKSLQKAPVVGAPSDYSRVEVARKQTTTEGVTIRKSNKEIGNVRGGSATQKKILAVQAAKGDITMGNDQTRMGSPAPAMSTVTAITETTNSAVMTSTQQMLNSQAAAQINNNIPVPVATLNAGQGLAPRMASIINSPADNRLSNHAPSPTMSAIPTGPRVVSTSSSKTITGGMAGTGPVKQHIQHRPSFGAQRTPVIQSAPSGRSQQQPIVRSVTPPMRQAPTNYRQINPVTLGHQSQNPTTVQITIHQPKNTVSNASASSDRLLTNTHYSTGHHGHQQTHTSLAVTGASLSVGTQQGLQRLVISQSPSGVIQQNKSTVPFGHESRIIAANTRYKKPVKPAGLTGQHDYIRSDQMQSAGNAGRKPPTDSGTLPGRLGVSIHTITENKSTTMSTGFLPTTSASTTSTSNNFHPTTINHVDHYQGVFKTHNYNLNTPSHLSIPPVPVPTIISASSKSGTTGPPTVIMGDSCSQDSNSSYGQNMGRAAGVSPSILRKRPAYDNTNAVVVKKISQPLDRFSGYDKSASSQPASPGRHHLSNIPIEKDNASQSSTDTAMSSESPNQSAVKHEPPETIENGETEAQPPDVSPRKKPRKQLLNTAAQLKDRHDSSTEEETETKTVTTPPPIPEAFKMEFDDIKSSVETDGFLDLSGVRWVKMRQRNSSSLMNTYPYAKHWNPRHNHFQRSTDFKLKEDRRPVVSELSNQRGIQQKVNGWKFYHLSAQFQEMIETEQALHERMGKLQKFLPTRTKDKHPELSKLNELAQANKQRCSLTKDQLTEAKSSLFAILDTHKPKIMEIIQKNHSKRPVKKKER